MPSKREVEAAARALCVVDGVDPDKQCHIAQRYEDWHGCRYYCHEGAAWMEWSNFACAALSAAEAVRGEEKVLKKWPYYASLRMLLAEAGEALKPFKKLADEIDDVRGDTSPDRWAKVCQWSDLVRARTVLAKIKEMVG